MTLKIRELMEPQPRILRQEGRDFVTILNNGAGQWISPYGKVGDLLKIVTAYPETNEDGQWFWVIEAESRGEI